MTDSAPPLFFQALGTAAVLVVVVGSVAWQMRRDRKEFNLLRVLTITFAALFGSLPFVAAFWWLAPHDTDRHSPLLLAAVFVPIFVLEVWGMSHAIRKRRQKHERPPT